MPRPPPLPRPRRPTVQAAWHCTLCSFLPPLLLLLLQPVLYQAYTPHSAVAAAAASSSASASASPITPRRLSLSSSSSSSSSKSSTRLARLLQRHQGSSSRSSSGTTAGTGAQHSATTPAVAQTLRALASTPQQEWDPSSSISSSFAPLRGDGEKEVEGELGEEEDAMSSLSLGQLALLDEVCLEVLEAVLAPDARTAEWLVRKALQRDGRELGNKGRMMVARRCLGVTSLKGRLEYMVNTALVTAHKRQEEAVAARKAVVVGTGKINSDLSSVTTSGSRETLPPLPPALPPLPLSLRGQARLLLCLYILHYEHAPSRADDLKRGLMGGNPALFSLLLSLPPPAPSFATATTLSSMLPSSSSSSSSSSTTTTTTSSFSRSSLTVDGNTTSSPPQPSLPLSPSALATFDWPDEETQPAFALAARGSLPLWLSRQWGGQYGWQEAAALAAEANRPGPVTLRWNQMKGGKEEGKGDMWKSTEAQLENSSSSSTSSITVPTLPPSFPLLARLAQEGVQGAEPCRWSPVGVRLSRGRPPHGLWGLAAWREGWFEVQDEGSQLVALATGVGRQGGKGGEHVLDICAGNGGKSLAMGSLMWGGRDGGREGKREGRLWVYDTHQSRLKHLEAGARRAGMGGLVRVLESEEALDALLSPETKKGAREEGKEEGRCDVVLVDAPCSSSGVLRRRPSLRWTLKPEDALVTLPAIQRALLTQAQAHVKVGGRLVYATCSLLKEENEEVVAWFLEQYGEGGKEGGKEGRFRALPWQGEEEAPLRAAAQAWRDRNGGEGKREELAPGTLQLLPHVHGTDGFYMARFERYR
ncbi:hypothetical protein VYU27_009278 [Nannochloropsis oceanica]